MTFRGVQVLLFLAFCGCVVRASNTLENASMVIGAVVSVMVLMAAPWWEKDRRRHD